MSASVDSSAPSPSPTDTWAAFAPSAHGPAGLPSWFTTRQNTAWESFSTLAWPARGDEAWRFADLKKLGTTGINPGVEFSSRECTAAVTRSVGLPDVAAKLVLGNDQLLHASSAGAEGLIVMPLIDALRLHGALIEQHFMAQPAILGGEKFAALHTAALKGGVFIYVPPGREVAQPIEIHQWLGGLNAATFPHVLVVVGRQAKVTVVDYFQSLTSEPGFACGVTDLIAEDGAHLTYVACQRWSRKVKSQHFCTTATGRDASVKSVFITLGAAHSRIESFCRAEGTGSRSEMLSLSVAEHDQEFDFRTRQLHRQPHTFSDLLFKNVLFDTARTIFSGLIFVENGAHFTDAYQTCRNLVLSEEAEANSLPGLEINADQVKCSHGSTSGPMSEDQIYYLRSRGIRPEAARQLLALGFCREVIERLGHAELEHAMTSMVEEKFRRMTAA
jgi:Fe-S cluster assembly protein SufD